jgi:hypothetical protein
VKSTQKKRSTSGKARRSDLARFNSALGQFLALPSHLEQKYTDVVTQVYPLRADPGVLQAFCDTYLNLSDDLPIRFKGQVPWVFMQIVDYGKMASTSRNVGWFSQHELAFGVPLQRYKREKGQWIFADWVLVFPFIFVDNPLSMSAGREIYGWSKAEIKIDTIAAIFQPNNFRKLASISFLTPGNSYGDQADTVEFVQIVQQRPFVSLRSALSDVLTAIPRAVSSSINASASFLPTFSSFITDEDPGIESLQQALVRFYGPQLSAVATGSFETTNDLLEPATNASSEMNIVTLKQVRALRGFSRACFQGIVGSTIEVEKLLDGGYLFDPLTGDATGGVQINLLETEVEPIVRALGISVAAVSHFNGKKTATLNPLLPFWLKMNLRYGLADYQYWRTETTGWNVGGRTGHIGARKNVRYLSMGSGAGYEVGGPRHYPRITFRILPLRANKTKLRRLISKYFKNDCVEFDLAGQIEDAAGVHAVVCLVVNSFEKMTARERPATSFSDRELTFEVPVLWWEKGKPEKKHSAIAPLYGFVGTAWNAATSYEVYGELALESELESGESEWMMNNPVQSRPTLFLRVKTELFPELAKSQEAQELPIVEVFSASGPMEDLSVEHRLFQIGLKHLWSGDRFHSINLKQIVDAEDPVYADYQALVALESRFRKRRLEHGPITPVSIEVFDYPTLPIVDTLGLRWDKREGSGLHPIYTLKPINPFWISGAMSSDAGREMCWRVGTSWQPNDAFFVR